jgi:hypothetical protein
VEGLREDFDDGPHDAGSDPPLKPPMAGLMRRIVGRQVRPWGASPQDPGDAIKHRAVLPPGAPSTVFATRQLGQEALNDVPLLVRDVTGITRNGVSHPNRVAPSLSGLSRRSTTTSDLLC